MIKISLFIIFTLFVVTPVFAGTYTVKKDGSGNFTTIQACANAVSAGDTCVVSPGTYSGASITSSGTAGNRITFRAASSGAQPIVTSNFNFTNESYITVDGFFMNGASFSGANCSFIEILNNTISKTGQGISGIRPGNDIVISGNTFVGLTNDIVNQWGRRWVIRNNLATGIADIYDEHLDFWQSWCGADQQNAVPADYSLIENNVYSDVSGGNVHFFLFHQTTLCGSDKGTNYIIRHNKIRNIGSNGVTFDNDSGAPGFQGTAIYNNTFIKLNSGSHSSWKDYTGSLDDTSGTGYFLNNLLYDAVDPTGAEAISPSSVPADNSLVYDPDYNVSKDGALKSSSGSIINQDPLLTDFQNDDFSLKTGSPAIDAGRHLTNVATADSSSGTSLVVNAPWFFQDGWGGVEADWIAVGNVSNRVQISSINYSTKTLTLATSISRSDGDPVYLYKLSDGTVILQNSAPDIGASEYGSGTTTPSGPTTPNNFDRTI